jgi:hypothetical protein
MRITTFSQALTFVSLVALLIASCVQLLRAMTRRR